MRRRSSVAAAGAASGGNGGQGQGSAEGSGSGTAEQEPGAEGEQEAKDDPRQTELQEEWRQLQVSPLPHGANANCPCAVIGSACSLHPRDHTCVLGWL